jgi:virulence-associated protein VapD
MRVTRFKNKKPVALARPDNDEFRYIPNRPQWSRRVYAICFDLDTDILKSAYHNASWQNGYQDIGRVLEKHGFGRQQGSVYFGDESVDPVRCVLAIQDVSAACPWFRAAVRDVRMLRIEENNDLMPAIGEPQLQLGPPRAGAGE